MVPVVSFLDCRMTEQSALAGKIVPFLSSFAISREKFREIGAELSTATHWGDVLHLTLLGWASVPLFRILFAIRASTIHPGSTDTFRRSYWFQVVDHVSQIARLGLLVYCADSFAIILSTLGFKQKELTKMSKTFAKILLTIWASRRIQIFKRYLIGKLLSKTPEKLGKATIVDRLLNGIILIGMCLFILDILSVEVGIALTSFFAVGSVGTLVVSLASKDLAAQLVNGLVLCAGDKFYEGDEVRFGDGTAGVVQKMGWIYTTIRGYDEYIVEVPNAQLGSQRVYNISRLKRCQVKQTLRFKYEDSQKLPIVLADIKGEIAESCDALITQGRSFRAKMSAFKENHIEAVVDCHFNLKPVGDEFWDNREKVLEAIDRAVRRHGVEFVTACYPEMS